MREELRTETKHRTSILDDTVNKTERMCHICNSVIIYIKEVPHHNNFRTQ